MCLLGNFKSINKEAKAHPKHDTTHGLEVLCLRRKGECVPTSTSLLPDCRHVTSCLTLQPPDAGRCSANTNTLILVGQVKAILNFWPPKLKWNLSVVLSQTVRGYLSQQLQEINISPLKYPFGMWALGLCGWDYTQQGFHSVWSTSLERVRIKRQ